MEVYQPKTLPRIVSELCRYHGIRRLVALTRYPYFSHWRGIRGQYGDGVVTLVLPNVFRDADTEYGLTVGPWIALLETTLHEIRHHHQALGTCADYHDDENVVGYRNSWPERDARAFARRELLRLANRDRMLFMPERLGDWGYLGARISQSVDQILGDIHAYDGFDARKWNALRAFWQFKHNAGLHVPAKSPYAAYAESAGIVHRTAGGRRYRFLMPAQTAKRYVFDRTHR